MQDLSTADPPHFGYTGEESPTLEEGFQEKLLETLKKITKDQNWVWQREYPLEVDTLTNERQIYIDIVGCCEDFLVAIELKYVTNKLDQRMPSAAANFPYDLIWDCAKLEIVGRAIPSERPGSTERFLAVVIGLTNSEALWDPVYEFRNWARNYHLAIKDTTPIGGEKSIGPEIFKTVKPNNLEATIFYHGRHHISLGYKWRGSWRDYCSLDSSRFRFLWLWSYFGPSYVHDKDDPATVPFLKQSARIAASHIRDRYIKATGKLAPVRAAEEGAGEQAEINQIEEANFPDEEKALSEIIYETILGSARNLLAEEFAIYQNAAQPTGYWTHEVSFKSARFAIGIRFKPINEYFFLFIVQGKKLEELRSAKQAAQDPAMFDRQWVFAEQRATMKRYIGISDEWAKVILEDERVAKIVAEIAAGMCQFCDDTIKWLDDHSLGALIEDDIRGTLPTMNRPPR
jgi:hypothetical protein